MKKKPFLLVLVPALLAWGGSASAQGLGDALNRARQASSKFDQSRKARRDAVIDAWIIGPAMPEDEDDDDKVGVLCDGKPCPKEKREAALHTLAGWLERMPAFLRPAKMSVLYWHVLPKGKRADGVKDGTVVTLWVPEGRDVDNILCHEIGHIFHDRDRDTVKAFLRLRHDTDEMRKKMGELYLHLMRTNPGRHHEPYDLDSRARWMIAAMRLPRRHSDDVHALMSATEYWGVSLELAYLAAKKGTWDRLDAFLSEEEVRFLRVLLETGEPPKPGA